MLVTGMEAQVKGAAITRANQSTASSDGATV